jgi:hypothetical protein
MFHYVWKVVLRVRHNAFASLSEYELPFLWPAQRFGDLPCHFAWQVRRFRRVVLCVVLRDAGLRQAVTTCIFRGWRGFLSRAMKIDGGLERNIDFEVANFEVHENACGVALSMGEAAKPFICEMSFCVAGVALCDIPKYGRRSTLDKSCCGFLVDRIVRAASSGDNVQIPWQGLHFVRCDEN